MTLRSWGTAPLSTQHCQQGSCLTSSTRCSSARHLLDSQMKITSTPRWLLLLCPARLKPLTIPSLHSNLKCTQVSRCKIKAPSVPSTASPHKVQVSPSWILERNERNERIQPSYSVTTEEKKTCTTSWQTLHLITQQSGQKARWSPAQHGCLWTDSWMTEHTSLENSIRVGAELKEGNSQGKKMS